MLCSCSQTVRPASWLTVRAAGPRARAPWGQFRVSPEKPEPPHGGEDSISRQRSPVGTISSAAQPGSVPASRGHQSSQPPSLQPPAPPVTWCVSPVKSGCCPCSPPVVAASSLPSCCHPRSPPCTVPAPTSWPSPPQPRCPSGERQGGSGCVGAPCCREGRPTGTQALGPGWRVSCSCLPQGCAQADSGGEGRVPTLHLGR